VGFVALDANDASYEIDNNRGYLGAAQDQWLRDTLTAMRSPQSTVDFIVVGFHHCAYCTNAVHGSDDGVRGRWQPLFDEFSVDLVVNGHNHSYERTHAIRRSATGFGAEVVQEAPFSPADPVEVDSSQGTTYITAGGGGQATYPTLLYPGSVLTVEGNVRIPEDASWSAVRVTNHSLISVDVRSDNGAGRPVMDITGLDKSGAVIDRVLLTRG
jgi:3',5'-cyclic AMP phosphodiesterase CpdA